MERFFKHAMKLPLAFISVLIISGCMTERVAQFATYPDVPKQSIYLVKKVEYDSHGRPLFQGTLNSRPGKAGELFAVVHSVNGKPVRSYDIVIVEQNKADMQRPLAVVYEWTGRGFEGGLEISQGLFPNGVTINSGGEALAYLAIRTAPVVIGGITGFAVGVLSSIPETASELRKVIVNARETVVGYTVYEYDEKGRIKFMKMYPPAEHAEELVFTEFHYVGEGDVPSKTEVTSRVEHKIRMVH
jgi:hypothetical protein